MKPENLIGEIFTIPVFGAHNQQYIIKEISELRTPAGTINYELKLDWIPSGYHVPHELIIQIEKAVNQKKMFTMFEIDKSTNGKSSISKNLVKDKDCSTMSRLRNAFQKLGTF